LLDDGTTPAAARLSTLDKIEVSEWLEPDGFSIDCAAQQVLKANVRFVPKADIGRTYSITSSARDSSDCGTERPSALAVLRLMTSSYFVGA
jgi:hypothetical protein